MSWELDLLFAWLEEFGEVICEETQQPRWCEASWAEVMGLDGVIELIQVIHGGSEKEGSDAGVAVDNIAMLAVDC